MATISEAFAIAVAHHQAGRLQAAEQIYRQILTVEPNHVDALHLLGVASVHLGKHQAGVECISRALTLMPNFAEAHNNLGLALQNQGKLNEAVAYYRRALELKPDYAEAHFNLGNAFAGQRELNEAVACYRRALELKPNYAEAHFSLGFVLQDEGKLDEAVACYHRALELKPDIAEVHNNLGLALQNQGELDEAVACYRRALELKPNYAEAQNNMGTALQDQGKLDDAVACYRRALELKPDYAEAHFNLGIAFQDQGKLDETVACYHRALELKRDIAEAHNNLGTTVQQQGKLDEAVACYRRAVELKPGDAKTHNNLGAALQDQGKLDEAVACYRRALELKPDYAELHVNCALAWLLAGDWQHGWPEYEWRWQTKDATPRCFPQPLWNGESLTGKTILLHAEQGFGDTIQFIRYAPIVKQHGATVIVECQKSLLGLLQGCPGVDQLIGRGNDLPAFDVHAPLLSLPGILKTSIETIPARVPYLRSKPAILEQWRKRLTTLQGFKIGINWRGRPGPGSWCRRDIPLPLFSSLAAVPNVQWISLQKGTTSSELTQLRDAFPILDFGEDLDGAHGAFMDTAAIMMNLDLVITSDTAVPHLAGALGVPVWVALPFAPAWQWLLERSDSPWYPTMRLFRQRERGNWHGVFKEIRKALGERLQSSRTAGATRPGM